ncbi:MAG: hypothetical protein ACYC40_00585 [Patescibacteria group bacterium]
MRTFSKSIWGKADPSAVTIIVGGLAMFFVAVIALALKDLFLVRDIPMYWALIYFGLVFIVAENKIIAAGLKQYFLHFATDISYGVFMTLVSCLLIVFFLLCGLYFAKVDPEHLRNYLVWGAIISVVISVALGAANIIVVEKKITVLHLKKSYDRNQIALIYYTGKGNEIVFYKKPLWGKFPYSIINLPEYWDINYYSNSHDVIRFFWEIKNVGNRTVTIPVAMFFSFNGPFQAQDFGNFLPMQISPEPISLEDEIKKIFFLSILPEDDKKQRINIANFLDRHISKKMFFDGALEAVTKNFPKKLFSNSEPTVIQLGKPKIVFETTV